MGRWRPPQPPSSAYITPAGFTALENELKQTWKRRHEVVTALSAAAAEGDRSENAEYIYRKKELGGLDRRIRYLQKRIPSLTVVGQTGDPDKIFFGAWVDLEAEDRKLVTYRIVGADETDAKRGFISLDSPLSKELLGKQVDDEIRLTLGDAHHVYRVVAIRYLPTEL
ncbi:MAG: transcription elongation factor GreB [Gammaproteobacteria bacterium]|nr:transcription elongation factor GreB [Gammaproteobacteria bacterium]